MADPVALVRTVRTAARDRPDRTVVAGTALDQGDTVITLPAGHVRKFPQAGSEIEFDDSGERALIIARDEDAGTIEVMRGLDGTEAIDHPLDTVILIAPRFAFTEIMEALNFVIDTEMWPHVWVPGETVLAFQSTNDYFSPDLPDIRELVYAYQVSNGRLIEVPARFLSRELAGDAAFPNGAILISSTVDSTDIFVSYRILPSMDNLTAPLERLVVLGAHGHLLLNEEGAYVGPDRSATERTLQPGSRLRAGAVLWDRFEKSRDRHMVTLQQAEQERRRQLYLVRP